MVAAFRKYIATDGDEEEDHESDFDVDGFDDREMEHES